MKNIRVFLSEKFRFLEVKVSIYLSRCVFVMNQTVQMHSGSKTVQPTYGIRVVYLHHVCISSGALTLSCLSSLLSLLLLSLLLLLLLLFLFVFRFTR